MEQKDCGGCLYGVPCNSVSKGKDRDQMAAQGWLSCSLRQASAFDLARYLSPNREACSWFKKKQSE